MENSEISKRYAEALASTKMSSGEAGEESLRLVCDGILAEKDVRAFFYSPKISKENKKNLIKKSFSGKIEKYVFNLVMLLIDKGREVFLKEILDELVVANDKTLNRIRVVVSVSRDIKELKQDGALIKHVKQSILENKKEFNVDKSINEDNLIVSVVVKPEILGGLIVRVGDNHYDGSVRNFIKNWKQTLSSHKMSNETGWTNS